MIKVTVEARAVIATFNRLTNISYTGFLNDATKAGAEFVKNNFDKSESPDGHKWVANRGAYAKWKKKAGYGNRPLLLLGELRDAIYGRVEGAVGIIGIQNKSHSQIPNYPWGSTTGSLELIGLTHEYGTNSIPARPFMGLSVGEADFMVGLLNKRVSRAIE